MNIFKYLAFVFLALGCSSEQVGKKPNIIIIMSDDMGFQICLAMEVRYQLLILITWQ